MSLIYTKSNTITEIKRDFYLLIAAKQIRKIRL